MEILWGPYQKHHITSRHGVTAEEFEQAWVDRVDLVVRQDDSYEASVRPTMVVLYLVWRWDVHDPERVFPITAYSLPPESE